MSNRAAYIDESGARIVVREAPYPQLKPGHAIIKNAAVALNPIDWKLQDFLGFLIQLWPTVLGSDVAGEIVEASEDVCNLKTGQRVIGHACALLTGDNAEAAFHNYTLVPANLVAPIPEDTAYEAAVVLPLSLSCAAAALYGKNSLALPLPSLDAPENGKSILIWGGSSSVASSAIQLARVSGLKVVATASPTNFEYVRNLGASTVFDYSKPDVVSELVDALKETECIGAFDTVGKSVNEWVEVLDQLGGGHVVATSDPPEKLPDGVTANHVFATSIKENELGGAIYRDYLPTALSDASFKPSPPPTIIGHGLEQLQAGLDKLKKGVSATKLVVTL